MKLGHGFYFKYQRLLDDEIEDEVATDVMAFIIHRHFVLPDEADVRLVQLTAQRTFLNRFQKPWAEVVMHLDRASDDAAGQGAVVVGCHGTSLVALVCLTEIDERTVNFG